MNQSAILVPARRIYRTLLVVMATLTALVVASVAMPRSGADAASLTSGGWTTKAKTTPATAPLGSLVTIAVTVKSSSTRRGLVDLEVYSPLGKVFQKVWDDQSFSRGVSRTFSVKWTIPANSAVGAHVVKVGMFGAGWTDLQHWNDSAGSVTVTSASPVTTTTVAPTTSTTTVPPTSSTTTTTTTPPPTSTTTTTTTTPPTTTTTPPTTTTTTTPPTTSTTVPPGQSPTRLNWRGTDFFATGVNVPWMTWSWGAGHGDFGGGSTDGVVATRTAIAAGFAQLQATGTHVVRWWTFEGDAWQINRDASGWPTSLNPAVYADFDAAMALANQYDLYYDFVLFGGPSGFPATWRTNPAQRVQLAKVLAPLFARYKDNPRLMSWEIFNEPEWEIWNNGAVVTEADVKAMAVEIIKAIRVNAPNTLVTVGQALVGGFNSSQRAIAMWTDVDLDYYSPHWYDPQTTPFSICALCTTAAALQTLYGTSKPIVIGEFAQGLGTTAENTDRLNQWYSKGFAGAWGWSLFPNNTNDQIPTDFNALTTFNGQHSDIGPKTP